jgi:hypothetical protein
MPGPGAARVPFEAAQTRLRWPMVFRLEPVDASFLPRASRGFDLQHDYDASPDAVHRAFLGFVGNPPWSPGFLGVDWWTPARELDGAVMDELYAFMTMRVCVIEHTPGARSVAYVDRWSLPLATRMGQLVETFALPNGQTRLRYRVAYDPPRLFAPMVGPVERLFGEWFKVSLRRLSRTLAAASTTSDRPG